MIITYLLIGFTVLVSYRAFTDKSLFTELCHHPYREVREGQYYRLLSGGFVHGSPTHLFINMWVLYQFGGFVEQAFKYHKGDMIGGIVFLLFYFSAVIISDIGTLREHRDNPSFRSVGASGATSALVFAYVLFDPWAMFLFPPVPAIVFAVLYLVYSSWAARQDRDNIDHLAHMWGGVYGALFMLVALPGLAQSFAARISDIPFLG